LEAARRAGLSRTSIYQALADGLPSVKVGRRRLVRLQALKDWLAAREAA
jgi:excisionase family DNA binding protein